MCIAKSYDDLTVEDKDNINEYYWEVLEPFTEGLGDPFPLQHIRFKFNADIGWGALVQIFRECGYAL